MTGAGGIRLAHLSDLHLPFHGGYPRRFWTIKRTLGYLNWHRGRKRSFLRRTVDQLVADLGKHGLDHVAVTGDLVNWGLPDELAAAADWLEALGPPDKVCALPGNHDIYVSRGSDPGVGRWRPYMTPDDYGRGLLEELGQFPGDQIIESAFPYVRRVGDVALIGLNSAVPTPPFVAAGELGGGQRERLGAVLERLGEEKLVRLVMIHHPPLVGQTPARRALRDADQLQKVFAQYGAELIIHGHNHTNTTAFAEGPGGPIPVLGIAAAGMSRAAHSGDNLGRYNLICVSPGTSGTAIEVTGRGLNKPGGAVVELDKQVFSLDGELISAVTAI